MDIPQDPSSIKLAIYWPFALIQQIRLVHALVESDYPIIIPESDLHKFTELEKVFGIRLNDRAVGSVDCDITKFLKFAHRVPTTSVGSIDRPLIFPRAIMAKCKRLWAADRSVQVGFAGLITPAREQLIAKWVAANTDDRSVKQEALFSAVGRFMYKVMRKLNLPFEYRRQFGPLVLMQSNRGRRFPGKSWDHDYFKALGESQFTLCPSGESVWSYRFFEAALCGSIPIVEESCEAYEGFRYFTFEDDFSSLEWSEEVAMHNYDLCSERLSINKEMLNQELSELVEKSLQSATAEKVA
ncbi:exostosin family protein [Aeoliella mucimassa]|uniref:Exostosin family protein n=1 Tax=Aeoliella mucimassa TaxID=2527972 RepID=A0A518ANA2_9BACT|nr:exostosin family protein [Aeoliella mucimassa]QDU56209.1 Exostosin family protein [Aeoliella mucimassa]